MEDQATKRLVLPDPALHGFRRHFAANGSPPAGPAIFQELEKCRLEAWSSLRRTPRLFLEIRAHEPEGLALKVSGLGLPLDALHLRNFESNGPPEMDGFELSFLAPPTQGHGADLPACGQFGGREKRRWCGCVSMVVHGDQEKAHKSAIVTSRKST